MVDPPTCEPKPANPPTCEPKPANQLPVRPKPADPPTCEPKPAGLEEDPEWEEGLEEVVRHNQVLDVVGWPRGHKPGLIYTETEGEEGLDRLYATIRFWML